MATEVFGNIGQAEMHESRVGENKFFRKKDDDDLPEKSQKIESSKPISKEKKEFLAHLENDSLTLDACDRLNKTWEK